MNFLKSSKLKIKYIVFTTEKFPIDSPGGRRISSLFDQGFLNSNFSALITFDKYKSSHIYRFPLNINYLQILHGKKFIFKFINLPFILIKIFFDLINLLTLYKIEKIYVYSRLGLFTCLISILSKIYNVELIIDCTEWFDFKEVKGLSNKLQEYIHRNFSMKLADHFFAIGINIYKLIKKKYPNKKVTLIYPKSPSFIIQIINSIVKKSTPNNLRLKTLLYAGSFKNSDEPKLLLDSLISLSRVRDFRLVIISKILVDNLLSKELLIKVKILQNNLKNNFLVYGYLNNKDYFNVINSSEVLLLPRSYYGYARFNQPMRLYEYSLFNKIIVTSNIDNEYQKVSNKIYLYGANETDSFFNTIKKVLDL